MSDDTDTPSPDGEADEPRRSVLAELPRTRPQRPSSRREAARRHAQQGQPHPGASDHGIADRARLSAEGDRQTQAPKRKAPTAKQAEARAKASEKRSRPKQATARAGAGEKRSRQEKTRAGGRQQTKKPPQTRGGRGSSPIEGAKGAKRPEPAPRQGFEPEDDLGRAPVSPPSGAELVSSLAELAGELAQTGISAGGKLLKSIFSRP